MRASRRGGSRFVATSRRARTCRAPATASRRCSCARTRSGSARPRGPSTPALARASAVRASRVGARVRRLSRNRRRRRARKAALAERLSRLAPEPDLWPTVARLRAEKRVTRPQVGTGELHHAHVLITTAALLPPRPGDRGDGVIPWPDDSRRGHRRSASRHALGSTTTAARPRTGENRWPENLAAGAENRWP